MSKRFKRSVFGVSVALIAFVFIGGIISGTVSAGSGSSTAYRQMGVYEEVLHKIQADYVVTPDLHTVTVGALHGLLASLDVNSAYFTPSQYTLYKSMQDEGTAQVGINVSKRYGYATVVSVIPSSPADKQGHIHNGDMIEEIGGKTTRVMSLAMIRLRLDGKPGTTVTFGLIHPGGKPQPQQITLTRVQVAPPPLITRTYDGTAVLYLKPGVITKKRVDQIESRLRAMKKDGNTKILLDLRDVTGGSEAQGIRLANAFLKTGTIAMLKGQTVPMQTFTADPSHFITSAPLAILVNNGTAGPAEIVAAAVLGNNRGDVVGSRTFGAGVQQRIIPLSDGAALLLTVAKYDAPDGKPIQDNAVTPNVTVNETIDQFLAEEDGIIQPSSKVDDQLNKALAVLKQKNS